LKKVVVNVCLLIGTIFICLVFIEVVIRIFDLTPDVFLQPDERTGVWHTPNKEGVYFRKDVPKVSIKINAYGLRDHEYPYSKSGDVYRIALLGDSFSEALQVPLEATYHHILEMQLNLADFSKPIEVINFGVGGFGTVHEYFVFHHYVLKYQPDMIVLEFMLGNDILENSPVLNGRKYLPYFVLKEKNELVYLPPKPVPYYMKLGVYAKIIPFFYFRIVAGNSKLDQLLRGIRRRSKDKRDIPLEYYIYTQEWNGDWEEAWEITRQVLLRLHRETMSHKMDLLIVGVPDQIQVDPQIRAEVFARYPMMKHAKWDWEKPNMLLQQFCQSEGIRYFDLSPSFKEKICQGSPPLYYHYDGHWNQNGHRFAAEGIYRFLVKRLP
jgi:hypothetical protein